MTACTHLADRVVELVDRPDSIDREPVVVDLAPDQVLFRQGDRGDLVYVVEHGSVALYRELDGGGEELLRLASPGEYFGELGPTLNLPRAPPPAPRARRRDRLHRAPLPSPVPGTRTGPHPGALTAAAARGWGASATQLAHADEFDAGGVLPALELAVAAVRAYIGDVGGALRTGPQGEGGDDGGRGRFQAFEQCAPDPASLLIGGDGHPADPADGAVDRQARRTHEAMARERRPW